MINVCGKFTIFLFLLTSSQFGCGFNQRLETLKVIENTRKFRNAQSEYKQKFGQGNYGSTEDLIAKKLLGEGFKDGVESGYKFNLTVEKDHYYLSVKPESFTPESQLTNSNDVEELSLYVDDTGVIRASVKPNKPADSDSSPIAQQ